jgi:hypothetical protein
MARRNIKRELAEFFRNMFYKVYRIELVATSGKQRYISFKRGFFIWKIINLSYKQAETKSEKEESAWTVDNITRLK